MANSRIVVMKFETADAAKRFVNNCLDVYEDEVRARNNVAFCTSRRTNDIIASANEDGFEYGLDYSFSLSTT